MTALGDDLSDNAATGAPQYIQFVEPRHSDGEIEILAFVGNRQPQLPVGSKARHLSPYRTGNRVDQRNGFDVPASRERGGYPIGCNAENPLPFEQTPLLSENSGLGWSADHVSRPIDLVAMDKIQRSCGKSPTASSRRQDHSAAFQTGEAGPDGSNPPPLPLHCHGGLRAVSTPPSAPRQRGRFGPVLTMLAMLGRAERPARDCAWLRSSRSGG